MDNKSIWRISATPKAITTRFTVTREFAITISAESGKGLGRDVVIWCCFSLYAWLVLQLESMKFNEAHNSLAIIKTKFIKNEKVTPIDNSD